MFSFIILWSIMLFSAYRYSDVMRIHDAIDWFFLAMTSFIVTFVIMLAFSGIGLGMKNNINDDHVNSPITHFTGNVTIKEDESIIYGQTPDDSITHAYFESSYDSIDDIPYSINVRPGDAHAVVVNVRSTLNWKWYIPLHSIDHILIRIE